jgi:LppP/LprE lipoprotein
VTGEYHREMRRGLLSALMVLLGVSGGTLLGGCGSATKTVSVTAPPTAPQAVGAATQPKSTTSAATPPSTTAPQTTNGGTPAPTSTRTAPEPAFAQPQGTEAEGLSAATAVLQAKGFTANDTSEYHPSQTLRVLIGTRSGSADGYGQQAFFFVNGRFIGTDSSQPSGTLRVVEQSDTEVTLAYPLYRKSDPLCCPSGGQATVRFQLNDGKLAPLDPIPPVTSSTGFSRQ